MKLLDLFCGAGGAAMGYHRSGFDEIVGVDNRPMPRYPFYFVQMDALEAMRVLLAGGYITDNRGRKWRLVDFDATHASPPCQFGSTLTPMEYRGNHPNLIPQTRAALKETGRPYVIENVENVRRHLVNPVMICGSMLGLGVWRHRYFETTLPMIMTPPCNHSNIPVLISGTRRRNNDRFEFTAQECRDAAGLEWMTRKEIDQAIPPAYTEHIGKYLIEHINRQ